MSLKYKRRKNKGAKNVWQLVRVSNDNTYQLCPLAGQWYHQDEISASVAISLTNGIF